MEILQELLVDLRESKQREKLLADENKAILSAISTMSEAKNKHEIFSCLNNALKQYINYDDFIVITRDDNAQKFTTLIATNSVFEHSTWLQGNASERALHGECILLFEPMLLKEFSQLNAFIHSQVNSIIMTGIHTEVTQNIILLVGSKKGHFSIQNRETLKRFRPLIERAIIDIENKEKLQRIVELRTSELAKAHEEAEKANQSKSEFLAMMSHEIRTPLNSVLGLLDILRQSTLNHQQSDVLYQMESSAELLLAIISDILDLSKIESGSFLLHEQWTNLSDKIKFVISQQKQIALNKNLTFSHVSNLDQNKQYWIDDIRLSQVLFNIIGNAIKFTDSGHVDISVIESKGDITFSIVDSGIGIPESKLDHLFTAFHQGDGSITRRFGGTGLGLAITKYLVEMMRGTITVESTEHVGSEFTIKIPVRTKDSRVSKSAKVDHYLPAKKMNFLVVEDTKSNQMVIKLILNQLGHNVFITSNGRDAIQLIENQSDSKIDMILMDVSMPVMDGITATQILRKNGIKIPIIALTAHALDDDKKNCLTAGMDSFISKPVRKQEVLKAIESLSK
ncbi:ATP-binding protein [Vibrio sagamiensis]|uniref:histidine kinase n=1 Tax=Vibrio sagamiensis NBRC 104589 TaxID=1219064 RepID=A0A511QDT1_9VIBR|nr:ATP-binding protein [Vibrio sagamiensis]PNQ54152.1 hybrid sensor histidine kinase/response regulator [Vibrio agarivorans]GEM74592.1 hybrid sensor histidine kinase/response regulator [Vibrio sagamiensis NBRC 104589]